MAGSFESAHHVLVFPFPAQGHMLPILDLSSQLAQNGLKITILVTPKNLPFLAPLLTAHPTIQPLVLPFPAHHPSLPPGVENVKEIGNSGNAPVIGALAKLQDPIVQWWKSQQSPPVAIISDFFLGWTQELAQRIGVPRIAFFSSGAFLASFLDYLWRNLDSVRVLDEVELSDFPRSPRFRKDQLPSLIRRYRESDPDWEIVKRGMIGNSSSWGAILNTFDALESEFLEHFKKEIMGHDRVYSVGPINLLGGVERAGDPNPDPNGDVSSWLDGCEDGSVLYVCFGSQKLLSQAQIDALAGALEQSGVKFIWVIKPVTPQLVADGYGSIPDEFETRISGKGLVIRGWAPQVVILSHLAVGGFLSHCGWNSVLEAVVAGVMILGWPMEADQFINSRILVNYMGAAVQVCEGGDTVPDPTQLSRDISWSMQGVLNEKVKASELREKALEAIKVGGSSSKDLEALVRELRSLAV